MMKQSPQETAGGRTRTHGNARRALLCTAALLSLGLAACNTTGGTTTTTTTRTPAAPTTELGKARAAAKAAMDAAKTQSDAAAVEAAKAEAAQMNIAMLQTGDPMAKTHAEAARAAARAAMTAYNTAKAESAKAAAATTDTAAVEARIAAQAAQRTAQAQAKIAMDKAAAAVKAAGMEVKVTYDDDGQATYRVGDVTIVAGAEKMVKTVNDGPKRTTGKIKDFMHSSFTYRDFVTYEAKDGNTPERLAQPIVMAQNLLRGTLTDSADDRMQLVLFEKYVTGNTNRMIKLYTQGDVVTLDAQQTEDAPYGTYTDSGGTFKIKRAEGEFYLASGHTDPPRGKSVPGSSADANRLTIAKDTKPINTSEENGVYYFESANGQKTWLKRTNTETDAEGSKTFEYHYISASDEKFRFPAAKSFEHLNYGIWAGLKEDGDTPADLGTGFVSKLPDGNVTPAGDMPSFGEAKYQGHWTGNVRAAKPEGDGPIRLWNGAMTTTANFEDNTLTTEMTHLGTLKGDIDGNGFSGTDVSVNAHANLKLKNDGKFTGSFSGNFFGPKAEEIGGVFEINSEGRKAGEARGAFGGGMTASE